MPDPPTGVRDRRLGMARRSAVAGSPQQPLSSVAAAWFAEDPWRVSGAFRSPSVFGQTRRRVMHPRIGRTCRHRPSGRWRMVALRDERQAFPRGKLRKCVQRVREGHGSQRRTPLESRSAVSRCSDRSGTSSGAAREFEERLGPGLGVTGNRTSHWGAVRRSGRREGGLDDGR